MSRTYINYPTHIIRIYLLRIGILKRFRLLCLDALRNAHKGQVNSHRKYNLNDLPDNRTEITRSCKPTADKDRRSSRNHSNARADKAKVSQKIGQTDEKIRDKNKRNDQREVIDDGIAIDNRLVDVKNTRK